MENTNKCPKCGAELSDGVVFCSFCGKRLSKKNNKLIPGIIIATVSIALIIAVITIAFFVFNSPINLLKKSLSEHNVDNAVSVYINNSNDNSFTPNASEMIAEYLNNRKSEISSGAFSPDDLLNECNILSSIIDTGDIVEYARLIKQSNENYNSACDLMNDTNYIEAVNIFSLVISDDLQYYESSQENIAKCKDLYCQDKQQTIEGFIAQNDYDNAISVLEGTRECGFMPFDIDEKIAEIENQKGEYLRSTISDRVAQSESPIEAYAEFIKIGDKYLDSETKALMNSVKEEAIEYITVKYNEYCENDDLLGAFNYIESLPSYIKFYEISQLKSDVLNRYTERILDSAKAFAAEGEYQYAIALLKVKQNPETDIIAAALGSGNTRKLYQLQREYEDLVRTNYIENHKSYIKSKDYDKFNHDYKLSPYSTNYYTDYSRKYNVKPYLYITDKGQTAFALKFGFTRDSWIFMDTIIIDCDGKQTKFNVKYYGEGDTNVNYGDGITETWYINNNSYDFSKLMDELEKASQVMIRFSGDKGKYDIVLSTSEVDKIVVFWNLYIYARGYSDVREYLLK